MFEFDEARILRIFNANGVRMSLKRAFELANIIYGVHLERLNEVENNIWDVARKEANKRVESAYQDGYEQGKIDAEFPSNYELNKLRNVFESTMRITNEQLPEIVERIGKDKKIQIIKEVRKTSGLGLREAKDAVDAYLKKLSEAEKAEEEAQAGFMETALSPTYYGDEPPF